jgi:hypothetical protein
MMIRQGVLTLPSATAAATTAAATAATATTAAAADAATKAAGTTWRNKKLVCNPMALFVSLLTASQDDAEVTIQLMHIICRILSDIGQS